MDIRVYKPVDEEFPFRACWFYFGRGSRNPPQNPCTIWSVQESTCACMKDREREREGGKGWGGEQWACVRRSAEKKLKVVLQIHTHSLKHTRTHIHTRTRAHTHMCTHTHTYTHTHTKSCRQSLSLFKQPSLTRSQCSSSRSVLNLASSCIFCIVMYCVLPTYICIFRIAYITSCIRLKLGIILYITYCHMSRIANVYIYYVLHCHISRIATVHTYYILPTNVTYCKNVLRTLHITNIYIYYVMYYRISRIANVYICYLLPTYMYITYCIVVYHVLPTYIYITYCQRKYIFRIAKVY